MESTEEEEVRSYSQSTRTKLRRRIIALVGATPNMIAHKYVTQIADETDEFGSAGEIRRELNLMIRERLLIETPKTIRDKVYDNISLPEYRLYGKLVSIRDMVAHKCNSHKLSFEAIRKRLLQGLTPEQALSIPKTTRGKLRAAVEEETKEDWGSLP